KEYRRAALRKSERCLRAVNYRGEHPRPFELWATTPAPRLGPIARRPALREDCGVACAQIGSLSLASTASRDENWRSPSDVLLAKILTVVIDGIHIEQLEVHGRVGVPASERAKPQCWTLNGGHGPCMG